MKKRKILALFLALLLCLQLAVLTACKEDGDYLEKSAKDLSTYAVTAELNEQAKTITAEQKLTYRNNTDSVLKELRLHLYPNAFREGASIEPVDKTDETVAYPEGKSYGGIEISKAAAGGGAFEIGGADENILILPLGKELFPDESVEAEICFVSKFPQMNHRFSFNDRVFNAAHWFPIVCVWEDGGFVQDPYYSYGDPFYSEMANFEVVLTLPKAFKAATTGNVISRTETQNTQTLTISARCVRDFAFTASKSFSVLTGSYKDITVNYFFLADERAQKNLEISVKSLEFFSKRIAEYPYAVLNVVQTDFCYGGMEYPNLVFVASSLSGGEEERVIVHEIAHQWWYNLVGNNQVKHAWLDEGLTEFSTAYFFKKHKGEFFDDFDKIVSRAEKSFTVYSDIVKNYGGKVDTTMNKPSNEFRTQQHYVIMTYVKGMLLFNNLCNTMGEKRFEKALKLYFEQNKTQIARPENLIASFEKAFGGSLKSYFDAWLGNEGVVVQ